MTKPDDNLRWALVALSLVRNRLLARGQEKEEIALHNLETARESIENARALARAAAPTTKTER